MRASLIGGILVATLMSTAAFSQSAAPGSSSAPAVTPPATTTTTTTKSTMSGNWRASKMMGLDIYNDQNEKLGDVSEIILDASGKVAGYVIGVGGFLGMGAHDIMVEPAKIKFVNEPARTAAMPARDDAATANASADRPRAGTTSTTSTTARSSAERWYPDHGVLSATKDELKAMPAFKYTTN